MSYRVFKRSCWKSTTQHGWPHGVEPRSVSSDSCPTIRTFDNIEDARSFCTAENLKRPSTGKRSFLAPYYEFTS